MRYCIYSLCILGILFLFGANANTEKRIYSGSIQITGMGDLGITISLSDIELGTKAFLTVPSQGLQEYPLTTTFGQGGKIHASLDQAGLSFVLLENEDKTKMTGSMMQAGFSFDLDFQRNPFIPTLTRPQNPKAPFPYSLREVVALHPDGHLLAGTLTIPNGDGQFPCAVLVSGSGQQDRDASIMGHKPFLIIADWLSRQNIAVLRYDDRGVGGSVMENVKDLQNATSLDFATDVEIMISAAKIHPEINSDQVGIIGHSEGGLIAPMVASKDTSVAFIIMLAGPGVPGYELMPLQQAMLAKASGVEEELVDGITNASMSLYELMMAEATEDELREQVRELAQLQIESMGVSMPPEDFNEIVNGAYAQTQLPWLRFFLNYDPAPAIAKLKCPVLAMNGTLDLQVSAKQNLPAIENAILATGGDITAVELDGLNHLFQPATLGLVSEYSEIETTFDPAALRIMSDWISEVLNE